MTRWLGGWLLLAVVIVAVLAVASLAGCARDQNGVADPAAFSFWVIGF